MMKPTRALPHAFIMNTFKASTRPWMFGPFAIYARQPRVARQVYETVRDMEEDLEPFGTVVLESGEAVDWVYLGTRIERTPPLH